MKIQFWHPRIWNYVEEFYLPLKEIFHKHTFLFPHEEGKKSPNSRETLKE